MHNAKLLIINSAIFFGIAYNISNLCVGCDYFDSCSMTISLFRTFLLAMALTVIGCTSQLPIEPKDFSDKNIPEHYFHFDASMLKDTIVSLFNFDNQYKNELLNSIFYHYASDHFIPVFFNAETADNAIFGKEHFTKQNTNTDIYLHDYEEVWLSKLYFSGNKALEYRTAFVIKMTAVDTKTTKVQIVAENPRVINGTAAYGAHGAIARETSVRPTTIEEYTLLLFISNKLGDSTMQPLKLPSDR